MQEELAKASLRAIGTRNKTAKNRKDRTMRAELKRLHSPDVFDLENHRPENPERFAFLLQAMVGVEGRDGGESFDIEVCTPKWLEETYGLDQVVVGRHRLIVREYNYPRIVRSIEDFLQDCSGESWSEIAEKVARLGKWEFEDYAELEDRAELRK